MYLIFQHPGLQGCAYFRILLPYTCQYFFLVGGLASNVSSVAQVVTQSVASEEQCLLSCISWVTLEL